MDSAAGQLQLFNPLKNIGIIDDDNVDKITCLVGNGGNVFVGTLNGRLMKFRYDQLEDEDMPVYFFDKEHEVQVGQSGSTVQSIALSLAANILFVLCQDTIICYREADLSVVPIHQRWKPISTFCMRDVRGKDDTWIPRLCLAYKSPFPAVQFFVLNGEHFQAASNECPIPGVAVTLNCSAFVACVGTSSAYYLVDLQNGRRTDLFDFPANCLQPRVTLVGKNEFLLVGPGGLGIYANTDSGASTRPPLQWSSDVRDVCFSPPYIFALDAEFVTVHSSVDQEQKQSLAISTHESGVCLTPSEVSVANQRDRQQVLLSSEKRVFVLAPQAWDQVCVQRLKEGRLREVVQRLQEEESKLHVGPAGLSEIAHKRVKRTHCLVGYALLLRARFREAQAHFESGELDIRELLNLYTHLLPAGYKFQSVWERKWAPEPLLKVTSMVEKRLEEDKLLGRQDTQSSDDEENQQSLSSSTSASSPRHRLHTRYAQFLMQFLEEHRESQLTQSYSMLVDTALIKLYADCGKDLLLLMATMSDVDAEDVVQYLEMQTHYHTCALIHRWHGNHKEAMRLWKGLCLGELKDATFPGIPFVAEILCHLEHVELLLEHSKWLLGLSQELGVSVFTQRAAEDPLYKMADADAILSLLAPFPDAYLTFLEYWVIKCNNMTPKYHQYLLNSFMEKFFPRGEASPENVALDKLSPLRRRFYTFLEVSNLYRVNQVLETLNQPHLAPHFIAERALLYGKSRQLSQALHILLNELQEWRTAEAFCVKYAEQLVKNHLATSPHQSASSSHVNDLRSSVFEELLSLYTKDPKKIPTYSDGILHLLNNANIHINPVKAIGLLPEGLLLCEVSAFLSRSIEEADHTANTRAMELRMLEEQHLSAQRCRLQATRVENAVLLAASSRTRLLICSRCGLPISVEDPMEKVVALLPQKEKDVPGKKNEPQRPQRVKHLFCPNDFNEENIGNSSAESEVPLLRHESQPAFFVASDNVARV